MNAACSLICQDQRQNYDEDRFCALGHIGARLHALVFTPRGEAMRVISLHKANKREEVRYERHQP